MCATPPEAEAFRAEVRGFLAEQLPVGWQGTGAMDRDEVMAFTERWRATLHQHGLLGVTWPPRSRSSAICRAS